MWSTGLVSPRTPQHWLRLPSTIVSVRCDLLPRSQRPTTSIRVGSLSPENPPEGTSRSRWASFPKASVSVANAPAPLLLPPQGAVADQRVHLQQRPPLLRRWHLCRRSPRLSTGLVSQMFPML